MPGAPVFGDLHVTIRGLEPSCPWEHESSQAAWRPLLKQLRNFDTYLGSGVVWLPKSNGKIKLAFEIL